MRKIEVSLSAAIRNNAPRFNSGNTRLSTRPDGIRIVTLHGNEIAALAPDGSVRCTLAGWNTVTTRSRLNAICNAVGQTHGFTQRNFEPYYGGGAIGSREWVLVREVQS